MAHRGAKSGSIAAGEVLRDSCPDCRIVAVERANLVSAAVVFEGKIDATLSPIISPFWNAYCRLADVREMMAFGLARLPRSIIPQ